MLRDGATVTQQDNKMELEILCFYFQPVGTEKAGYNKGRPFVSENVRLIVTHAFH